MAYKIQYAPEAAKRYPQVHKTKNFKTGRWILIALLFASAIWLRVNGVPDFLIPGNPEITKTAAAMFMDNIHGGVPMADAVTTFCQQIIHGAGL